MLNKGIDLFISKDRFRLYQGKPINAPLDIGKNFDDFSQQLSIFTKQNKHKRQCPITIYIGDDLLYFTRINLPKQTPDVDKAIVLQLDIISPFGENCLFAYEVQHAKKFSTVSLYVTDQSTFLPILETITNHGWRISGMYPESQRSLNRENRKKTWGLLSPGIFTKLTIFKMGRAIKRIQLSGNLDRENLAITYDLDWIKEMSEIENIPSPPASPLNFDLLPKSFRQTNYFKWAVFSILGLNLALGLLWLSMNFINLQRDINKIETARLHLAPQLQEVQQLKKQQTAQDRKLKSYATIDKNKNLITIFATLSHKLPHSSYLDQLRLDKKTGAIHIQGYTTDLNELTTSLPAIGNATLKSTRKRKGQTYFQVEVLPK